MATEYARLDLLEPIPTKGGGPEAHKVVIYRPTARQLTEVFDSGEKAVARLELFSNNCCRALNGTDQPLDFVFGDLHAADGAEIGSMIAALAEDARECTPDIMGDGFQEPLASGSRGRGSAARCLELAGLPRGARPLVAHGRPGAVDGARPPGCLPARPRRRRRLAFPVAPVPEGAI